MGSFYKIVPLHDPPNTTVTFVYENSDERAS